MSDHCYYDGCSAEQADGWWPFCGQGHYSDFMAENLPPPDDGSEPMTEVMNPGTACQAVAVDHSVGGQTLRICMEIAAAGDTSTGGAIKPLSHWRSVGEVAAKIAAYLEAERSDPWWSEGGWIKVGEGRVLPPSRAPFPARAARPSVGHLCAGGVMDELSEDERRFRELHDLMVRAAAIPKVAAVIDKASSTASPVSLALGNEIYEDCARRWAIAAFKHVLDEAELEWLWETLKCR